MENLSFKCESSVKSRNDRYKYTSQFNGDVRKINVGTGVDMEVMDYFFVHTSTKVPIKRTLALDMSKFRIVKNSGGYPWLEAL